MSADEHRHKAPMKAERWKQIEDLYQAALEQPAVFLARACPDDPQLRSEVESLLGQQADSFLESAPAPQFVAAQPRYRLFRRSYQKYSTSGRTCPLASRQGPHSIW